MKDKNTFDYLEQLENANVPEFVCCDEEKNDTLIEWLDLLPSISEVEICFEGCEKNMRPIEVANDFSGKGWRNSLSVRKYD